MNARMTPRHTRPKRQSIVYLSLMLLLVCALAVPNVAFGAVVDANNATKFTVNADPTSDWMRDMAGLSDGKTGVLTKESGVNYYRIYSSTGTLLTTVDLATVIPRLTDVATVKVMALANDRSLITWEGDGGGSCDQGTNHLYQFAILNNSDGSTYTGATNISTSTAPYNCYTDTAELSDGKIAFVWQNDATTFYTRLFNADGTSFSTPSPIETTGSREGNPAQDSTYTHSISANNDGTYLIVYHTYSTTNYLGIVYNNDGTQKTTNGYNQFVVASANKMGRMSVDTQALSNGNYLITYWNGDAQEARIITPDGTLVSTINNASIKYSSSEDIPVFISLNNGGFLVMDSNTDLNWDTYELNSFDAKVKEFDNDGAVVADWALPDTEAAADPSTFQNTYIAGYDFYKGYNQGFMVYNRLTGKVNLHNVVNRLTVTYDGNQQTSGSVPTDSSLYAPGGTVTFAGNSGGLAKTGYTFGGWNTQPDGNGMNYAAAGTTAMGSDNMIVYAKWIPNTYTVSFESNGGGTVAPVDGDYGAKIAAPAAPTKEDSDFGGWYKEAALTHEWIFGTDTVPLNGITLYAKWTIKTNAVTFKDWDGTVLKTETVNYDADATAPATDPVRAGYTFTGWDASFSNVKGALTVTAQYSVNHYDVSFESNGGSEVGAITGDYGTKIAAPAEPTKEDSDFGGWYKEAALTHEWIFGTDTVPVNGITLYAKWTIKTNAVTFKDWDGTVLKTETVDYNANATAPAANPTRTGYTFAGWDQAYSNVKSALTVTAQYTVNRYTVNFDSNGGSTVAPIDGDYGTKIAAPAEPTKEDSNFGGWYKEAALTHEWIFGTDTVPVDGITLYANWAIKQYAVTFKDWDGTTVLKSETVNHGTDATPPANPTRTGYTFTGWDTAYTNVKGALTVTAQYSVNQYNVSFVSNSDSTVAPITGDYGAKITAPAEPTKDGYDFKGWFKESNFAHEWDFSADTIPVDGTTLYAKWAIKTYDVTFKDWDGTVLKTAPVDHGTDATPPANPTRTGYTFTGWDTEYTNVKGALTVTAQYSVNQYNVSFVSNGDSTVAPITGDYGTKIAAPAEPTKDGYDFSGWYKESAFAHEWDFSADTIPVDGITLYANWTIKTYAVTFKDWDGTELKTETVNHDANATAPAANPVRIGYTFAGWDKAFTNVKSALTVTAQYTVNRYTVSFDSHGGSTVDPIDGDYGTIITAPAAPTQAGYRFDGWYQEAELTHAWNFSTDTVPVDGITLHAKWTVVFTVTYDGNGSARGNAPTDGLFYEDQASVTVLGNTGLLKKTDYSFAGWNTLPNGKGTNYKAGDTFAIDSADVTLYANWKRVPTQPSDTTPPTNPTNPTEPAESNDVIILVNGVPFHAGTEVTTQQEGRSVTTLTLDHNGVAQRLAAEGQGTVLTILSDKPSNVLVAELDGDLLKKLQEHDATLEFRTSKASYTLPGQQIDIDAIAAKLGQGVTLADISISIEIADASPAQAKLVQDAVAENGFALVVPSIDFSVHVKYGDQSLEITSFGAYVKRAIALPEGIDPAQVTTGIVVEADGTIRHIPTKVIQVDGVYYAEMASLTNSTYSVVQHQVAFKDVANHWSKDTVNAMGSRMIVMGTGSGLFMPNQAITRAEFAATLVRALGLKLEGGTSPFTDIKESAWYNDAVNTAYAYKLISGYEDGTFKPAAMITREQAMSMLARAMQITGLQEQTNAPQVGKFASYADANQVSSWAKDGVIASLSAGLVLGRDGNRLAPQEAVTRAEVAAMVERLLKKSNLI